jgi:hypothetical protein
VNVVKTISVTATNLGKCVENIRIGYINSEQRAYQRLSGDNPQTIGGKGIFGNFSFKESLGTLSGWRIAWVSLLPMAIKIGPAVAILALPFINWGFLAPVVDWIKNPFERQQSKWETLEPKPEPIPEPAPEPKPEPAPEPKPEPTPEPRSQPKQPPNPPGNLTPEEREADLKMYREAHAVREQYLPSWRAARTDAEKQVVLNNFLADLQRIKGTSVNPEIRFVRESNAGLYLTNERTIQMNMNHRWFNSPDALKVVMHEVRHAYQAEAAGVGINTPRIDTHIVSEDRRQLWGNNWNHAGFPVIHCVDARWFSGGI